jgi:hypothetical protein
MERGEGGLCQQQRVILRKATVPLVGAIFGDSRATVRRWEKFFAGGGAKNEEKSAYC